MLPRTPDTIQFNAAIVHAFFRRRLIPASFKETHYNRIQLNFSKAPHNELTRGFVQRCLDLISQNTSAIAFYVINSINIGLHKGPLTEEKSMGSNVYLAARLSNKNIQTRLQRKFFLTAQQSLH